MFADLHHLHQFISLEQGGSVSTVSNVAGTGAGEADIYFGAWVLKIFVAGFFVVILFSLIVCYACDHQDNHYFDYQVPPT
jgi:hypothetical protein